MVRDFRGQVEWLTKQEKRLKEEVVSLNEKLKQCKADLNRKDQIARDYKERMDIIQTEVVSAKDYKAEMERLKDIGKKQRLDLEVKEN